MNKHTLAPLEALLNQDLSCLGQLAELLHQEQQALGANDMVTLESLVITKNSLLDDIRSRAKEKVRQLVFLGYKPADGSASGFLKKLEDQNLTRLWLAVHQAMTECQVANNTNGQVIAHLQKRTSRLSEIIRGVNPSQKLYGAAGREESVGHKSILANA